LEAAQSLFHYSKKEVISMAKKAKKAAKKVAKKKK